MMRNVDGSAYKIATIDLSLIHGRPSQTAATLNHPAIQESSAPDSAVEMFAIEVAWDRRLSMESVNSHSRQESELSVSLFGSILYGGVSDPFGYKYNDVLPSTANSSKPSFAKATR